jgi:hypothetical protein
MKLVTAALALTGLAITVISLAVLSVSNTPPSETINTVGAEAYRDSACTLPLTSLNVGNVNPDSTVSQTIYIKNPGTTPITLTMVTDSWSPTPAASCLTLTWNRQNYVLGAEDSVSAILMLSVASDTVGVTAFSCNVTIIGT